MFQLFWFRLVRVRHSDSSITRKSCFSHALVDSSRLVERCATIPHLYPCAVAISSKVATGSVPPMVHLPLRKRENLVICIVSESAASLRE